MRTNQRQLLPEDSPQANLTLAGIALKAPLLGSISEMGIFRQLSTGHWQIVVILTGLSTSSTPRSRAAVRGLLRILWEFAMWRGDVPTQRNPMELVTIKGASKRTSKPRSLTVDEFQQFVHHLGEPFHTVSLVCVCFGLRISECLALRWSDVDWLEGKLS